MNDNHTHYTHTKRTHRRWRLAIALFAAFAMYLVVSFGMLMTIHQYGQVDRAEESDVIVVLGAGVTRSGRPGFALTRRSRLAAERYHQGLADNIICTGGHAPGFPRSEADACREVLMWRGVPADVIYLEDRSTSTEENAYFSKPIMEANGWETALVVSDGFHTYRANFIFNQFDIDATTSPVPREEIRGRPTYGYSTVREVLALQWQYVKVVLGIRPTG